MKKIVILVDQLHSHGGIEKLVAIKANYWAEVFGYKVTILSTEQNKNPLIYNLNSKVNFVDLNVNYNRLKSYFSFNNLIKFLKNLMLLQWYIIKNKPDFVLVASHIPVTYLVPFLIQKSKTIKEFHFSKFNASNFEFKNKITNYIESKYDYLVVLSNEEQGFYASKNTVVIANPIEKKLKNLVIDIKNKPNIAITILRFAPVKQIEKMVDIWSKFVAINSSWKLFIFGNTNNDYFETIEKLVVKNKMQDYIIFKGQTDDSQKELMQSKLVLMTSLQECFPMLLLEAKSVSVPAISFNCPTGPRNIINNNIDGFLIENDNIESFVGCLEKIAKDNELLQLLSKNALNDAENYDLSLIMNQWNTKIFNN